LALAAASSAVVVPVDILLNFVSLLDCCSYLQLFAAGVLQFVKVLLLVALL
jgi:hypothetical protein